MNSWEIWGHVIASFWTVWITLGVTIALSRFYRSRLSLYGRLFESSIGITGFAIVMFWIFTALFADIIAPFDPLEQFALLKRKPPGVIEEGSGLFMYFGTDNLGRDLFSRMVYGTQFVLSIAPVATLIAFMVGTSLGLAAGYFSGKIDTVLSFLANLILSFPVILLFYLLVTPGIRETAIPSSMAGIFFILPIIFFILLFWTRYNARPTLLTIQLALTVVIGGWIYMGLVFNADPLGILRLDANELNIFVAVVFASAPGTFRIVRGLTLDIKTRDYVAAAQTRGENPWFI
ncbi:MAG: ABC transporter permease, partial [Pseudomonadota bacterium]